MAKRILAVDDSRTMRAMLSQALVEAGYEVDLAEDGAQGLERITEQVPNLLITDINMPKLDGFGLIEAVRGQKNLRALPILVLTTESAAELKMKARKAGASGWIVKPFEEEKLLNAIRMVVA
ncbi:response regulator [Chachezhania antarctica]|uniref:response regulator n=1 Tax=Chachezhania antarctica TaxID=2340860 RepID=UPI000EB136B8|nr:response regulator [Chachezhania antarctica]|tara:strand:+ start:4246 stop:4611 length:366 start_codon:yes stop_codon:yes gene_type:complete